ncbi:MAG: TATA-box-binding protein [Methanospirillum sp.]
MSQETAPTMKIQNVVATVKVATELDLDELVGRIPGAEYDKKKFPGLVLRLSSPKVAALVFTPGKIVLTGMPHPDVLPAAFSSVLEALRAAGAEVDSVAVPRIVNLVASGHFGEGVALQRLAIAMNLEHIEYEPEVFPGLVYRVADPKGVALVFGSGAFVVTGTTNEADMARVAAEVQHAIDNADAWISRL